MTTTKELQNLLHQVSIINKKYEEIAAVTGENYNIFKILAFKINKSELQ